MSDSYNKINLFDDSLSEISEYFAEDPDFLKELVVEDSFINLLNSFLEQHWSEFNKNKQNEAFQRQIFKQFKTIVKNYIDARCIEIEKENLSPEELEIRKNTYKGDAQIDLLRILGNFEVFKTEFMDCN